MNTEMHGTRKLVETKCMGGSGNEGSKDIIAACLVELRFAKQVQGRTKFSVTLYLEMKRYSACIQTYLINLCADKKP